MATIEKTPISLRADVLDMGLVHLLETAYTVVIGKQGSEIVIELYDK